MAPAFFRIPSRYLPVVLRTLVFLYAFNLFSYVTADPDLWGHIKFGEEIWNLGALPQTNSYSYTAPDHPWINHEWLAEILFFAIYNFTGSTGLLAFKLAVGLFIIHLLSSLYLKRERNIYIYTLYFFLIIPVMAPGFMTRPHLMTFLGLAILIYMLYEFFDGNRRPLAWSPLLFLLWTNLHGGVVAGIGIYGLVTGIEWVRCCFTQGESHHKKLAACFALSCLAILVHPEGIRLWVFLYETLSLPREITEWNPVPIFSTHLWEFKLLCVLFVVALMRRTPKRIWEIAIILVAVVYGFKHQRHTVLTMIVMTPFVPLQLAALTRNWDMEGFFNRLSACFHKVLLIILSLFAGILLYDGIRKYHETDYQILVAAPRYPVYAAQFMTANGMGGNMLVPFDWGEYIIWKFPGSKVAVDGRFRTAYPEDVIRKGLAFSAGGKEWKALLEEYPTEIVLARKSDGTYRDLETNPNWVKIYEDPKSMIFVRKESPPGPLLQKHYNKELIQVDTPPPFVFPG